jgi:hypothetical protein
VPIVLSGIEEVSVSRSSAEDVPPEIEEDIRAMELDELTASDQSRIELALRAAGVARFLRAHAWPTQEARPAAFAFADRAARVSNLCISQSRPGGRE